MADMDLLDQVMKRNVASYRAEQAHSNLNQLNSVLECNIVIGSKPGIGLHAKAVIKKDDEEGLYKATYLSEGQVEPFKANCNKGFYIVKKWLKPEIDMLVKELNKPIRVKQLWRSVYINLVKGSLVQHNIRKTQLLAAVGILYYQKACKQISQKIKKLDKKTQKLVHQKAIVSAFEDQLVRDRQLHKFMVSNSMEQIKKAHLKANKEIRAAEKAQEKARQAEKYTFRHEQVRLISASKLHDLRKLAEKKTVSNCEPSEKWFGFVKNTHLDFLQCITGTPDWLKEKNSEAELEADQYFEALVSVLRICNITCSRQALFMVNRIVDGEKKVGIAEFKRTFNSVFKFHENSDLKLEAYTLTVSYLAKVINCKTAFRNIHYITTKTSYRAGDDSDYED
jgi:hypothetical protein